MWLSMQAVVVLKGQAEQPKLGIARVLIELNPEYRPCSKKRPRIFRVTPRGVGSVENLLHKKRGAATSSVND